MPINLASIHAAAQTHARVRNAGSNPVYVGGDDTLSVCEPLGSPPGIWTRFKAALVNVPLVGRLEAIRNADAQIHNAGLNASAQRFPARLRELLAQDFGEDIADSAMRAQPVLSMRPASNKTMTAHRTVTVIENATDLRRSLATSNLNVLRQRAAVETAPGKADHSEARAGCAYILLIAQNKEAWQQQLDGPTHEAALERATEYCAILARAGVDPATVMDPIVDSLQRTIHAAPFGKASSEVVQNCLARLEDQVSNACIRLVGDEHAPKTSQNAAASSSSRTSPRSPGSAHPDDVHLASLLFRQIDAAQTPGNENRAREAWKQLATIRQSLAAELENLPGITEGHLNELLNGALRGVGKGRSEITPELLLRQARFKIIEDELKHQFDPDDAQSVLWNAMIEATAKHPREFDANSTMLTKMLATEMLNDVSSRAPYLHEQFKCENRLDAVIGATRQRLIQNVQNSARGHLDALQAIDESKTLNDVQRKLLKQYASGAMEGKPPPRRLDLVQVRQAETIAATMADQIVRMQRGVRTDDPAKLFDGMAAINNAYRAGTREILEHAEGMWVTRSFDGTDSEAERIELYASVALAGIPSGTESDPAVIAKTLSGQEQEPRAGEPERTGGDDLPEAGFDNPVRQFIDACNQGASMAISKLAMYYEDIVRVARKLAEDPHGKGKAGAERAGDENAARVESAEEAPHGADAQQDIGDDQAGRRPLLYRISPALLVRTLGETSGDDEDTALDPRGILLGGDARNFIRRDFTPDTVRNDARHAVQLPPISGSLQQLETSLRTALGSGADIIVNGRRISLDPSDPDQAIAVTAFREATAGESGIADSSALAACLSAGALERFSADANAAAFDPSMRMANLRAVHELTRNDDGSWNIRSSRVSRPMSHDGHPLNTGGVVLYSLTHQVSPTDAAGTFSAQLTDSKLVFAF